MKLLFLTLFNAHVNSSIMYICHNMIFLDRLKIVGIILASRQHVVYRLELLISLAIDLISDSSQAFYYGIREESELCLPDLNRTEYLS